MHRYAHQVKNALPELDPKLHKELKQSGDLDSHCQAKAEQAQRMKDEAMKSGFRDYEAEEIARAELYN